MTRQRHLCCLVLQKAAVRVQHPALIYIVLCQLSMGTTDQMAWAWASCPVFVLSGPQFANKLDQLLEQVDSNQTQLCATDHIEVRTAHNDSSHVHSGMQSTVQQHGCLKASSLSSGAAAASRQCQAGLVA